MLVDGQERERRHHGTILRGRDGVVESGRRPGADERVVEPARPVSYDTRARAVSRPSGRSRRRTRARARQLVEQKREGGRGESLVVGEGGRGPRELRTTWCCRSGRILSLFGRINRGLICQMRPKGTSGPAILRRLGMGQVSPDAKTVSIRSVPALPWKF